jgi:hypothetical protein
MNLKDKKARFAAIDHFLRKHKAPFEDQVQMLCAAISQIARHPAADRRHIKQQLRECLGFVRMQDEPTGMAFVDPAQIPEYSNFTIIVDPDVIAGTITDLANDPEHAFSPERNTLIMLHGKGVQRATT